MQNILTGVYAAYDANAALEAALPGGLHFELAPPSTAMTYALYNDVGGRTDYFFAGSRDEIVLIQFDIFAATNALRLVACKKLTTVYDDARIEAIGYTPLIFERIRPPQFVRDGVQNEIFRAIVEYRGTWSV